MLTVGQDHPLPLGEHSTLDRPNRSGPNMDPDTNLREQREICHRMYDHEKYNSRYNQSARLADFARLVELVQALDQWLHQGGFKPARWIVGVPRKGKTRKGKTRCGALQTDTDHKYRCTLPPDHEGDHVMTTHPLHPTWKRS